ncbi:RAD55 family ATPase [Halorussus caseinilyticus]|uniref:RAD55 family ATPase n=1 Tax=Halorussus caseinilyticus TaxID=3034025 RepID=UPI0023E75D8F|nr:transcriptional regulator [Halorussus sp. DT72]
MARRLSTGIEVLDRKLDGGLPKGSIVSLSAPPASQAELLLYEFTSARQTLYLSTDRDEAAVTKALERAPGQTGPPPDVRRVPGDAPLDHSQRLFRRLPEDSNLVVDPVDLLEKQDEDRYRNFLNDLQNHLHNTEGVAILHCLDGRSVPDARDVTEHVADVVFQLHTEYSTDTVETRLAVPKFRGGRALSETIKLELAETVRIDTSRDIA